MSGILGRVTEVSEGEDHTEVTMVFSRPRISNRFNIQRIVDARARMRAAAEAGLISGHALNEALDIINPGERFTIRDDLDRKTEIVRRDMMKSPSIGEPGKQKVVVRVRT